MRGPGLRYRGRGLGRWPVFPRVISGRWPWRLNGDEARFPAVAPYDVRDAAERVGQGMLNPCADRDPTRSGYQFLVISSGRRYAFTTVEVLDERNPGYVDQTPKVYDHFTQGERPFRYDGVWSRYDQTTGAGINARLGPALYDRRNPDFASDVNLGIDDYSVMQDGDERDIGGGVQLQMSRNQDGS